MIKVCIIGGGNVAYHLVNQFLRTDGIKLVQLYNRNISSINFFKDKTVITDDLSTLKEADLYIISTSDDAIQLVSEQLLFKNRLVVHTSGCVGMNSISNQQRKGVFYPLQTLSKTKEIDFSEIPICIEAEHETDLQLLQLTASKLTQNVYFISSEQRQYLHVAAVFVNNFVNHLYHIGHHICDEHQIPFQILQPLIQETSEKIKLLEPKLAQTGPAKRNDSHTIKNHLKILSTKNQEIYKLLTSSIKATYEKTL